MNPWMDKLKALTKTGWVVNANFDFNKEVPDSYSDGIGEGDVTVISFYAAIGDSNCPHSKEYDPKDHHGYSMVDCDEIEEFMNADFVSLCEAIDMLFDACKEKEKIFGKTRG